MCRRHVEFQSRSLHARTLKIRLPSFVAGPEKPSALVQKRNKFDELGNDHRHWPNGCGIRWNSFGYLHRRAAPRTNQRTASVGGERSDRTMGELTKALHEDAEFTSVYLRGVQSFHDLDAVSKLRFSAFQNRFFKNFEGMYYSRREGILNTELWHEIDRTMSDFLAYKGIQEWWQTRRHWHTEAFARVVDEIIARGEKPTAYSTYDLKKVAPPKDSE